MPTANQFISANRHMLATHATQGRLEREMGHTPIPLRFVLASLTEAVCRPSALRSKAEQDAYSPELAYRATWSQAQVALNQHRVELELRTWGQS